MNLADRYIPIEDIPAENFPKVSQIVRPQNKVRVNNTLWEIVSTNDRKGTATMRLAGVFPRVEENEKVKAN